MTSSYNVISKWNEIITGNWWPIFAMFSIDAFSQQNVLRRHLCSLYWDSGTSTRRRGQVKHRALKRYRTLKQQRSKHRKFTIPITQKRPCSMQILLNISVISLSGSSRNLYHTQGWGQLHNINSNSNSNSRGFNSNSNSNSGQSPEYQLQLQLQRFQLQLQFQLRQISRISTPTPTPTPEVSTPTPIPTPEISTPIPTPTLELKIQPQLHFKSNQSCSTKLPLPNYNVKHCMN